jgi:hypothetical protein
MLATMADFQGGSKTVSLAGLPLYRYYELPNQKGDAPAFWAVH